MKINDVLEKELKVILVSESEALRLKRIAADFIKSLKGEGLRAFVGGSLAKNTMIRKTSFSKVSGQRSAVSGQDRQDVDIFVVFNYSEDTLKLGGILEKMNLPGKLTRVHGSRDYFHIDCENVILEVIPVVKNGDPELAENVMDVSLSHVKYISGEVTKNPGIADEIRLAKAFCRAQKCYGAEGYVRGFSGYSLEILVIHFGGFVKFLKGIRKNRVVDTMKYFKNEKEIMRELNANKLQGPVVIVDPTYKFRNVCAGLGFETFERFLEASGGFLKSPSLEFFKRREVDLVGFEEFAKKKGARFMTLELLTDRQEGDIAGTKMKKMLRFFVRELMRNGQEVLKAEFDYSGQGQKAFGYLVVLEKGEIEVRGPSVGLERQAAEFCKAKGDLVFKKKGFWWWKKKVSVDGVLKFVQGFEGEMGAGIIGRDH